MLSDLSRLNALNVLDALGALGLKLPKAVTDAAAALAAAKAFAAPAADPPDWSTIRPGDVEAALANLIDREVRRQAAGPIQGDAINRLGRRLVVALKDAAPGLLDKVAPRFEAAAERFGDLHGQLPDGWRDPASLVDAGSDAVRIFTEAQQVAAELDRCAALRDALAGLGHRADGPPAVERGARHCSVTSKAGAERAAEALRSTGPLDPWAELLTTPGVVGLRWRSIEAQTAEISTLPDGEDGDLVDRTDGFGGKKRIRVM